MQEGLAVIAPRTFAVTHRACLLLGTLLALAGLSTMAWAGTATATEATVSVADLEHLTQQIATHNSATSS